VVPFFFGKDNFIDALTVYVRVDGMTYSVRDKMVPLRVPLRVHMSTSRLSPYYYHTKQKRMSFNFDSNAIVVWAQSKTVLLVEEPWVLYKY
jgi:hypothetical protein